MAELKLSLACWDYDRVAAIHDGRIGIDGATVAAEVQTTAHMFPLAVGEAPYDITEMSFGSYLLQAAKGEGAYIALPVFLSRAFRHGGIYVRADGPVETPKDLEGRLVGVPEYQMTAALWIRGLLADEYDVDIDALKYRTAGLNVTGRKERLELDLPAHMDVMPAAEGSNLNDLLLAGEIDAILAPAPPTAFSAGDGQVKRLIADTRAAEKDYYARTGIFPTMHVAGLRKTLADAHPGLATAVYDAFLAARRVAMDRIRAVCEGSANRITVPWFADEVADTRALMGDDYWPYGMAENLADVAALCRYAETQYLTDRRLDVTELFHPETHDLPGR